MEIHTAPYDNGGLCGPVVSLQLANSGYNTEEARNQPYIGHNIQKASTPGFSLQAVGDLL